MKGNFLYNLFSVVRIFLYPFTLLYGSIVWLRNRLYDTGFFSSVEFSVPVICVGNLSTGGTGKTPHIEYLVRLLQYQYKVATMSRGYKRHTQGFLVAEPGTNALRIGDEPMQFFMKFPDLVVSVAEDRMTGIPTLLQKRPDINVVLLDDAYQHRSVKAGLTILITDYNHPYYNDHILPFGSLREGKSAARRADIVIVSKCPPEMPAAETDLWRTNLNLLPHQKLYFTTIGYGSAIRIEDGQPVALAGKNVLLVCGIAKPAPLIAHISEMAASVHPLTYRDHHYFVSADIEEIKSAWKNWNVPDKILVTTEKDATRLLMLQTALSESGIQIQVLPIMTQILFNQQEEFNQAIVAYMETATADYYA